MTEANGSRLPRMEFADGTLEGLKWLALVLMVVDHINKFLFREHLPYVFEAARIAMPLFGFVLAYNLARPGTFAAGGHVRVMQRLTVYGLLASPMFVLMVGWWPANIMFLLLLATAIAYLIEMGGIWRRIAAILLFIFAGAVVEFWWFALIFILAAWRYCKSPSKMALLWMLVGLISLHLVNRNWWALAVIPVVGGARYVHLQIKRQRTVFYAFYPAHLAVLYVVWHFWLRAG